MTKVWINDKMHVVDDEVADEIERLEGGNKILGQWVEDKDKQIERLQREVDALMPAAAEPVPMGGWQAQQEEIERLQATVEHLQDTCKEKHDSMIAMMNEALGLRAMLLTIRRSRLSKLDAWAWLMLEIDKALRDAENNEDNLRESCGDEALNKGEEK